MPRHPLDNPCPLCSDESRSDGVISSCIDCFLSGGDLYRYEYGVTRAFFIAKARGGTCTLASSESEIQVIHRAFYFLRKGFGVYDVMKNNCEDFALCCKTGLKVIPTVNGGGPEWSGCNLSSCCWCHPFCINCVSGPFFTSWICS